MAKFKIWKRDDKVIKNNNTMPAVVLSQNEKTGKVLAKLVDGGKVEAFSANDLKRRRD